MKRLVFLFAVLACGGPATRASSPGPIASTTSAPAATTAPVTPAPTVPTPIGAMFVETAGKTFVYTPSDCTRIVVAVARGSLVVDPGGRLSSTSAGPLGTLGEGDAMSIMRAHAPVKITGDGLGVLVEVPGACPCEVPAKTLPAPGESWAQWAAAREVATLEWQTSATILRGESAQHLTWGGGTMSADRLTYGGAPETCKFFGLIAKTEANTVPELYLGRLASTGSVGEHMHPSSWEILFAIDAKGTFTVNGEAKRLGAKEVVMIPPGTKHSWTPDAHTKFAAIQVYTPPGPEERFEHRSQRQIVAPRME